MKATISKTPTNIDEYIEKFPPHVQEIMQKLREVIHESVPEITEGISYQMPTFKLNGKYLLYFGGWKKHIGIYALPSGVEAFAGALDRYQTSKGTIQFPLDEPIPYDLVSRITKYRAQEVLTQTGKYGS